MRRGVVLGLDGQGGQRLPQPSGSRLLTAVGISDQMAFNRFTHSEVKVAV